MIEKLAGSAATQSMAQRPGKILKMVENPRMGGSVPAWVNADSAQDIVTNNLAMAGSQAAQQPSFKSALAYKMQEPAAKQDEEFGFYDLLDMINPLQHIPVVNMVYRELTGDEIKSAPQVIGGALFGGPVGAAASLANVIVKEETGNDIAGNAFNLVRTGEAPRYKQHNESNETPEQRLAEVLSPTAPQNDLPISLLAFVDATPRMSIPSRQEQIILAGDVSAYEIY